MTVLFADICGSTRLYASLGDRAAREIVDAGTAVIVGVLPQYRGRLVKTLGDEVMCVFPNPSDAVAAAIERVGMTARRTSQIGALSGGQRRRAFLARAVAAAPDLYLLDEPVTGVDATTEEDLMRVLEAEVERGRTVVASTHDLAAAAHHFHEVILMNGRVVASGPASLLMDRDLLRETYGGHVVVLPEGELTIIDDAHHHDDAPAGERHFHEGRR